MYPQVAAIDCRKCKKFAVDLKTGQFYEQGGLLVPRGRSGPPCLHDKKACPKGAPGQSDLTPQNHQVLQHFMECRAVGEWPDDNLVREHAALLNRVVGDCEETARRRQARADMQEMALMMARMRR